MTPVLDTSRFPWLKNDPVRDTGRFPLALKRPVLESGDEKTVQGVPFYHFLSRRKRSESAVQRNKISHFFGNCQAQMSEPYMITATSLKVEARAKPHLKSRRNDFPDWLIV